MITKLTQISTEKHFFSFMIPITLEKSKKATFLKGNYIASKLTKLRLVECDHENCGMK
jgi:hypothetical protein